MRPVVRTVLPLLLATVAAPALGARAGAQPGCPTAPVFDYFRPGGGGIGPCRVGDWVFTGFQREGAVDESVPGTIHPTSAGNFLITPFIGSILLPFSDSALRTVGFEFTGFTPHVSFSGTTVPHDGGAGVYNGFNFRGSSLLPDVALVGAMIDAWAGVDLQSDPSLAARRATAGGSVRGESGGVVCFEGTVEVGEPGRPPVRVLMPGRGICPSPLPGAIVASVGASAFLGPRSTAGGVFLSGTSSGTIERITFITSQVVPEPTTVALLGGGLALLGITGWRRRRARG